MKYKVILWILALAPLSLMAQEGAPPCGTYGEWSEQITRRLQANLKIRNLQGPVRFRETQYVPVKFHLVAQNDGGGRVPDSKVLDQLCAMNNDFADFGIQFFIKDGFDYLDNSAVFNDHVPTINTIMTFNQDPGALNIWVVDDATPSNDNDVGITLGYYDPGKDWVVVNRDYISDGNSILTHELGHFFSLLHPHNGWDAEPFRDENKRAPATSPGGVPTEKVDGSNCQTAGDMLCDTPPDYNGLGIGCDFSLKIYDPDSTLIDPDESNFMSYFLDCPRSEYKFSEEQKELMLIDMAKNDRNRLRNSSPGSTQMITATSNLLSPINGEQALGAGTVQLQWDAVEGATSYLVEVARTADFNIQRQSFTSNDNGLEVPDLTIGLKYFWRIRPFNDYSTCSGFSTAESFVVDEKTATVNTIQGLEAWSLFPNPANGDRSVWLGLESNHSFEASVDLFTMDGRHLQSLGNRLIPSGSAKIEVPLQGVAPGVYLLALTSREGRLNQRVVVVK